MGYRVKPFTMAVRDNSTQQFIDVGLLGSDVEGDISDINERLNTLGSDVEGDISDINERLNTFALYIGNSYAVGTDVNVQNGLYNRTKDLFTGSHLEYAGGAGFVNYDDNHITFLELMQRAVTNESVDVNEVTHVVVISAMGDSRAYGAGLNVRGALSAFATYARNTFPNLKEIILALAEIRSVLSFTNNSLKNLYTVHKEFKTYSLKYGIHYIGWIGWPAMYDSNNTLSDHYHPSTAGYEIITQAFRNSYCGEMQYMPFRWSGASVWSIPSGIRVQTIGSAHPDESFIKFTYASTSNIPDTFDAVSSGDSFTVTLPSTAVAVPMLEDIYTMESFNIHWGGAGKQLTYLFNSNIVSSNGSYVLGGIVRMALNGTKSELVATAQTPVNITLVQSI